MMKFLKPVEGKGQKNARPDGGHNPTLRGFRWMAHACGDLDWMKHMLATNEDVMEIAEQLIGKGKVAPVESIRGIYCTLPYGDRPAITNELVPGGEVPNTEQGDRESCHNDAHGMHLGIVGRSIQCRPVAGRR